MPADLDDLVEAARNGSRGAFDELVRCTYQQTYTLALRLLGHEEDARDVTQETYLRAFRALPTFRGDAQFSTWLYRITANCASTHLGRRSKHRHDELPDDTVIADTDPSRDPAAQGDLGALRTELVQALGKLPPKLRAVVVLRDIYDLSHAEIATELGISESAAKVRLHRARRKLREDLFPLPGEAGHDRGMPERTAHAV
jgi:RNA polymerase sigma-70 factor (ECF subfamily)